MRSPFQVVPFDPEHLDSAAGLLAGRQRRLRALRSGLPSAFEEPAAHLPALTALLEREGARGVAGMASKELVGFLVGYSRNEPIWGRACWSPSGGSALAE